MFFKRFFKPRVEQATSAFVHQLTEEEMRARELDITHLGAVFNISHSRKEDILMIEKLKAYLAELENKKAEVLAKDITPAIEEKVAEYRAKCITEAQVEQDSIVAKIDSDIDCITKLIAREEEAALATTETECKE